MTNNQFMAGMGKCEIKIPLAYLAAENFSSVHDCLYARAMILKQEQLWVLVSLDVTSLPAQEIEMIRQQTAAFLGIDAAAVWVCVVHTFSVPHVLPETAFDDAVLLGARNAYSAALIDAGLQAVKEAYDHMAKAVLGFSTGACDVNINRDVEIEEGWWLGANPERPSDKTVSVIRLNREDGTLLGVLYHYACQSSVLDQSQLTNGGKAVCSDLVGQASLYVEKTLNTTVLFLLGAAGDQAPCQKAVYETFRHGQRISTDLHEAGFTICEKLGRQLGQKVCEIADSIQNNEEISAIQMDKMQVMVPGKEMNRNLRELHPTRSGTYTPCEDKITEIEAVSIGEIAFLGVKPELNCITALNLVHRAPFKHTLIATMVNGGAKYMADEASYDLLTYEAMNSPFGKGAAEILTDKAVELLERMKEL